VSGSSVPVTLSAHTSTRGDDGSDNIPPNSDIVVVDVVIDSNAAITAVPMIVNIKASFDILLIEEKNTYYIALQN
jgi:hypothetical protein